jgi:hypothetical protein
MRLPAVCGNCGTIFPSGYVVQGKVEAAYFEGNQGTCPVCGQMARIPDGLFNFADEAIEVLQAPDRTVEDLRRFGAILQDLREKNASAEEVRETIEREAPWFAPLARLLPQDRNQALMYLAVLLQALQLLLSSAPEINIHDVYLNSEIVIEDTVQQEYSSPRPDR